MKKVGLVITTALIAVAATGCQNWTGKNTRDNGKCNKNSNTACDKKNMQCNKSNPPQSRHCGPKYQNNCRCSPRNQSS